MTTHLAEQVPTRGAIHRVAGDGRTGKPERSEVYLSLTPHIAKFLRNEIGLDAGPAKAAAKQMVELIPALWGGQSIYFVKDGWEEVIECALDPTEVECAKSVDDEASEVDLDALLDAPLVSSGSERAAAFYAELSDGFRRILIDECMLDEDLAAYGVRGVSAVIALSLRGALMYFPKESVWITRKRDEAIFRRLHRGNAFALAREYGVSYVRVYQIARAFATRTRAERTAPKVKSTVGDAAFDELPPINDIDELASAFASRPQKSSTAPVECRSIDASD